MTTTQQRKRHVKRGFHWLAGSPWAKHATTEKSITERTPDNELGPTRQYPDIKMSTGDLDPAVIVDPMKSFLGDGEWCAFDSNVGKGCDPKQHTGEHHEGNTGVLIDHGVSPMAEAAQAFSGSGFAVQHFDSDCTVPRRSTPWWITTKQLKLFLAHRAGWKSGKPPLSAALDYIVLTEYYIYHSSDGAIARKYHKHFEQEGDKRFTNSANAVKNRRARLVKLSNERFGANEEPGSRAQHYHLWREIREGPDRFRTVQSIENREDDFYDRAVS
jgi:hypothetical protein